MARSSSSSSSSLARAVAMLLLITWICSSLASAAPKGAPAGNRVPIMTPSPRFPSPRRPGQAPFVAPPPPLATFAPNRKTLAVASFH